jgi:oxygen-independent coproporphyrinogen-3 oxidase
MKGRTLDTIYFGGGTPTSLKAEELDALLTKIENTFDLSKVQEFTVEAGRPDSITEDKFKVLRAHNISRISINPQTFSDEVLANIGRKHSAQDILDCYAEARAAGHDDINMDLIAGLPGDTVEGFEKSLRQAIALDPENITVHTLTLKRASRIVIEDQKENDYANVAAMLEKCHLLAEAGYRPYYLYRQKNTLQNLENVGWCKPGHEGYYNIYIMEEVQTILSAGAGGSTKLVADGGKRMQRIFNFKYPTEYIQRFDEVLERKKGVAVFYDHDLGTETSG